MRQNLVGERLWAFSRGGASHDGCGAIVESLLIESSNAKTGIMLARIFVHCIAAMSDGVECWQKGYGWKAQSDKAEAFWGTVWFNYKIAEVKNDYK